MAALVELEYNERILRRQQLGAAIIPFLQQEIDALRRKVTELEQTRSAELEQAYESYLNLWNITGAVQDNISECEEVGCAVHFDVDDEVGPQGGPCDECGRAFCSTHRWHAYNTDGDEMYLCSECRASNPIESPEPGFGAS